MGRKPKTVNTPPLQDADLIPSPYNLVYTGRDPNADRLVTTLMLAAEALAEPHRLADRPRPSAEYATPRGNVRPHILDDFAGLQRIVSEIETWLADGRCTELLSTLREGFGDGDALRLLFRRLFSGQVTPPVHDAQGNLVLSPRELEVLREAAGDRSHQEIATRLGLAPGTANRHLNNIYRKLGVHRPMQAVARAVAMGYLDLDVMQAVAAAARCRARDFGALDSFLAQTSDIAHLPEAPAFQALAEFGLLLMALTGFSAQLVAWRKLPIEPRGVICEVNRQGEIVRTFGEANLTCVESVALAPPQAAQHGFTPGHLFAVHPHHPQYGLNSAFIAEFTPEGRLLRVFCGSQELGTRLLGVGGMVFAADGRLLVPSDGHTDAILDFRNGGKTVERLADGCFTQICVGQKGNLYASQYSSVGSIVKVFDPKGALLHTFGGSRAGQVYLGIAVNSRGHVFINCAEGTQCLLEEFDPSGQPLGSRPIPGFDVTYGPMHLAIDGEDRLYLPCPRTRDVKIHAPDGSLRRIDLHGKVVPRHVAIGTEGRLWVCGEAP